nr:ArpU family phage packaging/lysis transcriptional regulator [Robertmurraya korlensis]
MGLSLSKNKGGLLLVSFEPEEFLPILDRKQVQADLIKYFSKYRLFKYLTFEEREASITSSSTPREHGATNVTSDQTASIAIYNTDEMRYRKNFCERLERSVRALPKMERFLIEERYMSEEAEYTTDLQVYNFKFQPPISEKTYSKIRWKAFYKLAISLNIVVPKN